MDFEGLTPELKEKALACKTPEELVEFVQAKGAQARFNQDITGMCVGREMFMRLALDSDGGCNPTESFVSCPFGGHFLQLSHGAIWPCQVTAHHDYFSKRFGYDMHDGPEDSLPLECIASIENIETFRRKSHPMCRFCDNESLTVMRGSVRSSQKMNGSHRGGPDNQACAHHSCSMFDQLDATRETGQFSSVMPEGTQESE